MARKPSSKVDYDYIRCYSWALITYHDVNTINDFLDRFEKVDKVISHYAFIKHDKDIDKETKAPEINHIHILLVFKREKSLRWIQSQLDYFGGCHQNTLGIRIQNKNKEFDYLTHKNDKDKFLYNDNEVFHNGLSYWLDSQKEVLEVEDILTDFDNHVPLRSMAIKYGRDFMKNYNSYYGFWLLCRQEELQRKCTTLVECNDVDLPF